MQHSCFKAKQEPTTFALFSAEEAHLAMQKFCEELKEKLSSTEAEKANQQLMMSAEIDDLNRTKTNLEERLIELIRYEAKSPLLACAKKSCSVNRKASFLVLFLCQF